MSDPAYKPRFAVAQPASIDPDPLLDNEPLTDAAELDDDDPNDPYYYGWRERWEKTPDGQEKLRRVPLTYQDLLDPEEGDFIAEDTVHRRVCQDVANILERRCQDDPAVAVWSNLKIAFVIPGLTTGPGPDVCVVAGVRDRDRLRRSFRYSEEPGTIRLVVEVVSKKSLKKDYQDLLEIYARLGVEEYVAIRPLGLYSEGPFTLKGWRLEAKAKRLHPIPFDPEGRLHLKTVGVLFGTGAEGWGLALWDAATGERLRTLEEEAAQLASARRAAEERAEQEARARRQEARARREAEERQREMRAEIERLRARLQEREDA